MRCSPLRVVILTVMLACCSVAFLTESAAAASSEPLFVLKPVPVPFTLPVPPPTGQFEGPCGLAVDAAGNFYVSDYYHHAVDVYTPGAAYLTQLAGEDPLDGPCGLALGPTGGLYVNNFHRNVVGFGSRISFGTGTVIAGAGVDSSNPTGVAVDGAGVVYVDERDHVATFGSAGVEGEPIGSGSLGDGYGLAVSAYPATAGFVYVADAGTETVKVYDPATSRTDPVAQIDGSGTPLGRFVSLRDASVAVDDITGTIYVIDDLTPEYREGHEGVVYAFDAAGAYIGRLKYAIQTALPAGLAVDNSSGTTQGRVYVTSGYTEAAEVYAYGPGSAGTAAVGLSLAAPPAAPAPTSATSPAALSSAATTTTESAQAPAAAPASGANRRAERGRTDRRLTDVRKHHRRKHRHRVGRGGRR